MSLGARESMQIKRRYTRPGESPYAGLAFKTVVSLSYAAEKLVSWILTLTSDPLFLLLLLRLHHIFIMQSNA